MNENTDTTVRKKDLKSHNKNIGNLTNIYVHHKKYLSFSDVKDLGKWKPRVFVCV